MSSNEVSFRGNEIPEVSYKSNFEVSDSRRVIDKISSMSSSERNEVTINAVNYGDHGIANVQLTTGDIVPIETAIALAENHMLSGYSTGKTVHGGRTLRSKPSINDRDYPSIHSLPTF